MQTVPKKIETTVDTDKSHNGTQHNSSMIVVTRIRVSAIPRNEHRHKSANFSRSLGRRGEVLKNLFFTGRLRPKAQALIIPFYIPFSTEKVPLSSTFTYNHGQKFLGQ